MIMKSLFILLALTWTSAWAAPLPQSKNEFCARFNDPVSVKNFSYEPTNLMAFKNNGGLFNGGVCWWHSRFQRNILYLSQFRPDLPRPNVRELKALIKEIRNGQSIITIPGFANFTEFSAINQKAIQSELNSWQIYDGVVLGSWIDGLEGDSKIEPAKLKLSLDQLYDYVEVKQKVAYQKLQIKGITSHAWLIVGMKSMPAGFEVGYVDSNNPQMCQNYSYKNGDDSFYIKGYGNFVPYLGFTREEERLTTVAKSYCGLSLVNDVSFEQWEKDYQLDLQEMK
jgi:hypothetical protein